MEKFEQVEELFVRCLKMYHSTSCQCAYPRFQQIAGINCSNTGNAFKSNDTELLISLSKTYFDIVKSERTDEVINEKWICKSCGSTYEYGWSDFSIYVDRQKLTLTNLMVQSQGKPPVIPIPLCIGLVGHSYPPLSEITSVNFIDFEKYMTEQ